MKTTPGHIVFLHDTMHLTPAEIARRTGSDAARVSEILTRFYQARARRAAA